MFDVHRVAQRALRGSFRIFDLPNRVRVKPLYAAHHVRLNAFYADCR
jgi:hypothetical protein